MINRQVNVDKKNTIHRAWVFECSFKKIKKRIINYLINLIEFCFYFIFKLNPNGKYPVKPILCRTPISTLRKNYQHLMFNVYLISCFCFKLRTRVTNIGV